MQAVDLLNQAVARDPSFFDAYCQLAYAHDGFISVGNAIDHTPARLALAEAAIQAAARLNPNAGETHLARAQNLYWGYLDYDGALAELEIARQTLPNDFRVPTADGSYSEASRTLGGIDAKSRARDGAQPAQHRTKSGDCNSITRSCGVMLT